MARDKDTVIFMSAYETTKYSKARKLFPPKVDVAKLLKKHHISYLMYQNKIIAPDGILELNPEYDDVAQETTYTYEAIGKDKSIDDYDELINNTGACIKLMHSCAVLTDPAYFRIDHVFGLESFVVYIDDAVFQIDPLVFSFNRAYIVAYEMIDLATGMPLGRDDTSPKMRNWNLRKIKGYKYFNEDFSNLSNYTIPELIFTHISDYFYELVGKRFAPNDYTYVHDTLVMSNGVRNVEKYFNKLLGFKTPPSPLENISTTDNYEYYLQDGASLVIKYNRGGIDNAIYNALIYESIKLHIYLRQIINEDTTEDLNMVMRNDLYLENLFFAPHVPAETKNVLRCIYNSVSYQQRKKAVKLKISYMRAENEVKKNRNTIFLNILLYIAALLGAISTLDILDSRLNIPFEYSIIIVVLLFGALGAIWLFLEYRNNKKF